MQQVDELREKWKGAAETLRQFGAVREAEVLERCAQELDRAIALAGEEQLRLADAARESGYSEEHLGRLVRSGNIPNAGRRGAPRILRRNVPRRIANGRRRSYDPVTDARNLLSNN